MTDQNFRLNLDTKNLGTLNRSDGALYHIPYYPSVQLDELNRIQSIKLNKEINLAAVQTPTTSSRSSIIPESNHTQNILRDELLKQEQFKKNPLDNKLSQPNSKNPISPLNPSPQSMTQHSLHSGNDVQSYLRTPGGVKELNKKRNILNQIAAQQKEQWQSQLRQYLLKRIRLFLKVFSRAKKKMNSMKKRIQEQAEFQRLQLILNSFKPSTQTSVSAYNQSKSLYAEPLAFLNQTLSNYYSELNQLSLQTQNLKQQEEIISHRYGSYHEDLYKANHEFFSLSEKLFGISSRDFEKLLNTFMEQKADLKTYDNPYFPKMIEQLNLEIEKITRELLITVEKIPLADDPQQALLAHNCLLIKVEAYKDFINFLRGEKIAYTKDGQPAHSLSDTSFLVPTSKKLIMDGNQYYLISSHKDFQELTSEEKNKANIDYKRSEQDLLTLQLLVINNYTLEMSLIAKRMENIAERREIVERNIEMLQTQQANLQNQGKFEYLELDNRAELKKDPKAVDNSSNTTNNPQPYKANPSPSPKPTFTTSSQKKKLESIVQRKKSYNPFFSQEPMNPNNTIMNTYFKQFSSYWKEALEQKPQGEELEKTIRKNRSSPAA